MQLTEHVHMLVNSVTRQYLILERDRGAVLIDTGLAGNAKRIFAYLQQTAHLPSDCLHTILITHADGDHYGALNEIRSVSHARVLAGEIEAQAIRAGRSSREMKPAGIMKLAFHLLAPMFKVAPADVDGILQPGQELPALGGLQVMATPGHTPGHLSFYAPKSRVLFSGDSIKIQNGSPAPSSGGNTWDQDAANRSFELQMALDPAYICGGHCLYRAG